MTFPVLTRFPPSIFLTLLILSLVSSCRHVSNVTQKSRADVGYTTIVAPESNALVLASNQTFVLGEPLPSATMPGYPAAALASGLPDQFVCVSVVVTAEGSVKSVTPIFAIPDCPLTETQTNKEFVSAVVGTVSRWEFYSSQTCTFPTGAAARHRCSGPGVEVVPIAVTHSFRFLFSVKTGVGAVSHDRRKS